jgi:DNA-binding transcriptional ArsR family regulator
MADAPGQDIRQACSAGPSRQSPGATVIPFPHCPAPGPLQGADHHPHLQGAAGIRAASALLGAFADETRLRLLFRLHDGEKTTRDLERLLDMPGLVVSRQLAGLRRDRIITSRSSKRGLVHALADSRIRRVTGLLLALF